MILRICIVLISISSLRLYSQTDIQLSALDPEMVISCNKVVRDFIKAYNDSTDLRPFLTSNEANFGGQVWMPIDGYIGFIGQLIPKPINDFNFKYHTIDEVDANDKLKESVSDLSRVFNNYSVLAEGNINGRRTSIVLNLQGEVMKIYSITIWDVPLINRNAPEIIPGDTIDRLKIALDIPDSFEDPTYDQNFISYVKKGETIRDETIQITNNPKQAPLKLITYKWAEYVTSSYRRSEFDISLIPVGYVYNYELVDDNGRLNKGITIGIEHKDQIIFIQYFGFKESYSSHWQEIDQMIRSVKKL